MSKAVEITLLCVTEAEIGCGIVNLSIENALCAIKETEYIAIINISVIVHFVELPVKEYLFAF